MINLMRVGRRRRFDRWSELCLACAFVCIAVGGTGYAQQGSGNSDASQDYFRGSVTATLKTYGERLDNLEHALNWAAGALILQLGAHALQITTQIRKRRSDDGDDDRRPRVSER